MMRFWYLLKLLRYWPRLKTITPHPLRLLRHLIQGKPALPLQIDPAQPEKFLQITPPNLYGLLLLLKTGLKPHVVKTDELSWELAPGRFFHTRLSPGMDLMTLYEIFVRQDYGSDFSGKVVLDVGAYNGDSAVFFALRGAKKVIALEPYPPSYALAQANIARMGLADKITLLPAALGTEEGHATFRIASTEPDANTLAPTPLTKNLITFDQEIQVPVYSLEKLLQTYGSFDFVKLDCEGCEFAIAEKAPEATLRAIPLWHIEYHAAPKPLENRFRALGFQTRRYLHRFGLGYLWAWQK